MTRRNSTFFLSLCVPGMLEEWLSSSLYLSRVFPFMMKRVKEEWNLGSLESAYTCLLSLDVLIM